MPVRFRCAHCGQLLGIAESKAGLHVDCPVCGRSVRVPTSGEQKSAPPLSPRHDPELTRALSQLSGLGESGESEPAPATAVSLPVSQPSAPADERAAPIAQTTPPDLRPPPLASDEMAVLIEDDAQAESAPREWTDSLRELAQHDAGTGTTASQQASSAQRGRLLIALACVFLLGMASGAVVRGFLTAQPHKTATAAIPESPAGQAPEAAAAQPPEAPEAADSGLLRGTVTWSEPGREPTPDSGALVLLVPARRDGDWLLDSRALRTDAPQQEQDAVRSALNTLGVSVQFTNSQGQFELPRLTETEARLVIISRHVVRTNADLDASAASALALWFSNPAQLVGRLAVQTVSVPRGKAPSTALTITFP